MRQSFEYSAGSDGSPSTEALAVKVNKAKRAMTRGRSVAILFIVISSRGLLHPEHTAHRDPLVYYRILALYPKSSGARIGCAAKRRGSHPKGTKSTKRVKEVDAVNS